MKNSESSKSSDGLAVPPQDQEPTQRAWALIDTIYKAVLKLAPYAVNTTAWYDAGVPILAKELEGRLALPAWQAIDDMLAYGEGEKTTALKAKDREQYQFWGGWVDALTKLKGALEFALPPPPAAAQEPKKEI